MFRILLLATVFLSACAGADQRFLIDSAPAPEAKTMRLRVSTLEVREVSLPAYAEDSQILLEDADGALTPAEGALWADEPVRAVTLLLVDQIGRTSNATVAAEPWPLETPAQAAVHVRVSEMVARASGTFDLKGQFAISSYEQVVRERIKRFEISVPLKATTPAGIAQASGAAMQQLASEILKELSR
ncbi:PqiC family protein [Primorskyibacter sp. 2E233]|uniref:PqiC family protein n=1 Tax=Primorskyibacter sp. 2E233 TaxID=3413431 RepID=UPI003BF2F157